MLSCETGKINEDLDAILLDVIDETFRQIFGGVNVQLIYDSFERNCRLKREEIVGKPHAFSSCLESLLGSAAPAIERLIIKNLYHRLGIEHVEKEGIRFPDFMNEVNLKVPSPREKADESPREAEVCERKWKKRNLRFYKSILGNMQVGLNVWHLENADNPRTLRLIFSNRAADQILGIAGKKALGRPIAEIFPNAPEEFHGACAEVARSGRAKSLTEFIFSNECVAEGIVSEAFPLPDCHVGMTFQKIFKEKRAEKQRTRSSRHRKNRG